MIEHVKLNKRKIKKVTVRNLKSNSFMKSAVYFLPYRIEDLEKTNPNIGLKCS